MADFKAMLDFSGQVVVVSGGLGLIGKQISLAFIQHKATVVVADIDEKLFESSFSKDNYNGQACFELLDISNKGSIEAGIKNINKKWGKIDVWVNAAYPRTADWGNVLEDVSFESWNANIQVHLGGYFWAAKCALEQMKKRRSGCLINIGSHYGVVAPNFSIYEGTKMTMPVAYSAIKAAIINLSKYFATYYAPFNIRVNCICPAGVFNNQDDNFIAKYNEIVPLKRMARDYEIAMPVLFLASEGASYITGHNLMVDGGLTIW